MKDSIDYRRTEGQDIADECYIEVDSALKNLLSAIEGFRRDVELAKQSDSPIKVHLETKRIFIPPAKTTTGIFTGISETLVRTTKAFDGSVELGLNWNKSESLREKAWTELYVIHENLVFVGAAARVLYKTLESTSRAFHSFNGYNDEVHVSANILFEDDALNVCIATSRAIIEHAVRLDIDIMEHIEKLRANDSAAFT